MTNSTQRNKANWRGLGAVLGALTMSSSLAVGLSACSADTGAAADENETTGVSLSLTAPPSDAKCYRATFTPATGTAVVKTFAPVSGASAPTAITGIAAGPYTLGVDAFNVACASLTASSAQSWVGDPLSVTLATGLLAPVTITLRRPAVSEVTVDYDTSSLVSMSATPVVGLSVVEPSLYVAHPGSVERLPTTGGSTDVLGVVDRLKLFAADATGYYYTDINEYGPTWVAPGRPGVPLSGNFVSVMVAVPGAVVVGDFDDTFGTPRLRKLTPTGTPASLDLPGSLPWALATDGTSAFGTRGFGSATWIEKYPLNGAASSVLVTLGDASTMQDISADSGFVYIARVTQPGTPSGIFRVPNTGGALQTVATVSAGTPTKLIADGTNVYFVTTLLDNVGQCQSGVISKVPRAGGTVTPMWSRKGVCPTSLALGSSGLFFDGGNTVYRLDK